MTNEVFKLMRCFRGSFINDCGEVILDKTCNVCFCANDCETRDDVIKKLLYWCTRAVAKGMPYAYPKKNLDYRKKMRDCFNTYLETKFTAEDMELIYDRLGNGVNPGLTKSFMYGGYDVNLLRRE